MASLVKMPISNLAMDGVFTCEITVAADRKLTVLLDTGSSTLVVDGRTFDPSGAPGTRTTNLAQTVSYGAGSWVGAIVQTSVGLTAQLVLPQTQLAVTYGESAGMFSGAQGILGLAYAQLDPAYEMPGDTWAGRYSAAQVVKGAVIDPEPYFSQLEEAGVVANKFAFSVPRCSVSLATDDPATDPQNAGLLVLGGGEEATELYAGAFTAVEVVDDEWYDVNLIGVQVGTQPRIAVPAAPANGPSNSFVDSGTSVLMLDQPVYDAVVAAFRAIDPAFANALAAGAVGSNGIDHATLDLPRWPELHLVLQGHDQPEVTITMPPSSYWQLDAAARGRALAYLLGDGGSLRGRSILGLPVFCGRYTVFDRTADGGRGVIRFATRV